MYRENMEELGLKEELADMLERMAISYEADAIAQGKKHMGSAFLNGYQTAISNMLEILVNNQNLCFDLKIILIDMMGAFDELCRRGGVKPTTTNVKQ